MAFSPEERNQVTLDISEDAESPHSANDSRLFRDWTSHTTSRLMADSPRQGLSSGLNSFIREITPFLGQVNNAQPQNTSWLNRITSNIQESTPNQNARIPPMHNESVSHRTHINLGPPVETFARPNDLLAARTHEISYNDEQQMPVANVGTDNVGEISDDIQPQRNRQADDEDEIEINAQTSTSDLLVLLRGVFKYAPVFLILLAKFVYDYSLGLLSMAAMIFTFYHANNVAKEEAAKHTNRNRRRSVLAIFYTMCCIVFVEYINDYNQKYSSYLILMPNNYEKPLELWEMIWVICITDFILKFITIDLKLIIICLPEKILPYKKKGKFYFFIEALSQLYRSMMPIQPWLRYLLESYQGYEKILSVALSTAYIVSKGFQVVKIGKLFKTASMQLMKSSNLGVTPNEDQMNTAGKMCPICHEEFNSPVLLNCSHIFCETCLVMWFNKVQTCPLCRAQVIADSSWRDGGTSHYCQLY